MNFSDVASADVSNATYDDGDGDYVAMEADDCPGPTPEQMDVVIAVHFWVETFGQSLVCVVGFVANLVVIPILCGGQMKHIFHRVLASLVFFDNAYLALTLLEAIRREVSSQSLDAAHCVALYPMRNVSLCCQIYLALMLALERYRAIRHPIQYHNATAGENPWRKATAMYVLPAVLLSFVVNAPKFFELEMRYHEVPTLEEDGKWVNVTKGSVYPSEMRFKREYVLWYKNVFEFLSKGLVPLALLMYLNYQVWAVIRRRRQLEHRFINQHSTALKVEAARQAQLLFSVCLLFLFGHALRIALNIHELFVLEEFLERLDDNCYAVHFWPLVLGSVSHLFLAVSSAANIGIYCVTSRDFRQVLIRELRFRFQRGGVGGPAGGRGGEFGGGGGPTPSVSPTGFEAILRRTSCPVTGVTGVAGFGAAGGAGVGGAESVNLGRVGLLDGPALNGAVENGLLSASVGGAPPIRKCVTTSNVIEMAAVGSEEAAVVGDSGFRPSDQKQQQPQQQPQQQQHLLRVQVTWSIGNGHVKTRGVGGDNGDESNGNSPKTACKKENGSVHNNIYRNNNNVVDSNGDNDRGSDGGSDNEKGSKRRVLLRSLGGSNSRGGGSMSGGEEDVSTATEDLTFKSEDTPLVVLGGGGSGGGGEGGGGGRDGGGESAKGERKADD